MPSNQADYAKDYYAKNKERLLERQKAMQRCDLCDVDMQAGNKWKHSQSKRHLHAEALQKHASFDVRLSALERRIAG
jgi:hypothetical protein